MCEQWSYTSLQRLSVVAILTISIALRVEAGVALASSSKPPKYDHVVVVIMENHSFDQIFQTQEAVYLKKLVKGGAVYDNSYGIAHPSQPNYFALFSGSTQGVDDDGTHSFAAPNLAGRLRAHGRTFAGYVEAGSPRKHNPWESFADAKGFEKSLADFPLDYAKLPSVSFVIPNLSDDMHDGMIKQADIWLRNHLGGFANWSKWHNSLLIVTFDEDDNHTKNHIFTVFYGFGIEPGRYSEEIDHYSVLRTIENIETISPLGTSAVRKVISSGWKRR